MSSPDDPSRETDDGGDPFGEPIEVDINGTLDLHGFRPRDIGSLIPEYLDLCREKDILQVRIIHGKGTGALRQGVHVLLDRLQSKGEIVSYALASGSGGGYGATIVHLQKS